MSEAAYVLEFTLCRAAHTITPALPVAAGVSGDHRAAQVRFVLTDPPEGRYYRIEVCDGGGGYDVTGLLSPSENVVAYHVPAAWTTAGIATLRLTEIEVQNGEERQVYHYPPARLQFEGCPAGEAAQQMPAWQQVMTQVQSAAQDAVAATESAAAAANTAAEAATAAQQAAASAAPPAVNIVDNAVSGLLELGEGLSHLINALDGDVTFAFAGEGGVARQFDISFSTGSGFSGLTFAQSVEWETVAPALKPNGRYRITVTCADLGSNPMFFLGRWSERTTTAGELATKAYVDVALGEVDTALDGILAVQEALIGGDAQ